MTNPLRAVAVGLIAFAAIACAPRSAPIATATPPPPAFVPTLAALPGARIVRLDPPGAGGSFTVRIPAEILNPNRFDVRVDRVAFTLGVAERDVAQGEIDVDFRLPPAGRAGITFDVDVALPDDALLWRDLIAATEPVAFALEGRVTFATDLFTAAPVAAPRIHATFAPLADAFAPPLLLTIERRHGWELRDGSLHVRLALAAANPGAIGYFLTGRSLSLSLLPAGDRPPSSDELLRAPVVANSDLAPMPLRAGATEGFTLAFDVPANLLASDSALLLALQDGRGLRFALRGALATDVLGRGSFLHVDDPLLWGALTSDALLR
jgi:hypothetical protein